MKKILFKTGAILLLLGALHSCSKDDVVDNSSKNTQGESNSNPTTISKDYARLEFPKIKNTANNKVLVYKTTNGEVNYCVEWDKRLQISIPLRSFSTLTVHHYTRSL